MILFHDCWNLQMRWNYRCAFKNVYAMLASFSGTQLFTSREWNRLLFALDFQNSYSFKYIRP